MNPIIENKKMLVYRIVLCDILHIFNYGSKITINKKNPLTYVFLFVGGFFVIFYNLSFGIGRLFKEEIKNIINFIKDIDESNN